MWAAGPHQRVDLTETVTVDPRFPAVLAALGRLGRTTAHSRRTRLIAASSTVRTAAPAQQADLIEAAVAPRFPAGVATLDQPGETAVHRGEVL
ncbi:hypothetical protein Acsp04_65650 [Actinomadura sp. NBRC 104425]|nr:hypothetical protein Acsp04_65650 [Actinomadura sp. NBRC 104425]